MKLLCARLHIGDRARDFLVFATGQMLDSSVSKAWNRVVITVHAPSVTRLRRAAIPQARIYNPTLIHAKLYFS